MFDNGKLTRTIPVTTGMPGFTTRSGTKVIIEKYRYHTMNSETIGIDPQQRRTATTSRTSSTPCG